MYQNLIVFILFATSLSIALSSSLDREFLFLFWFPVVSAFALLFLILKERLWFWAVTVILICAVIYKAVVQSMEVALGLYCFAFFLMVVLVERLQKRIKSEIMLNNTIVQKSKKSLQVMQSRSQAEEVKIEGFRSKVNSITRLFEVAKDFNTCLTLEDLIDTVEKSVLSFLRCENLRILLLPSERLGTTVKGFRITNNSSETWIDQKEVSKSYLEQLLGVSEVQKFISPKEDNIFSSFFDGEEIMMPLWVFPLKIEHQTIAFLFLEKAKEEEFYQFQIIAGQLALQIQKTLLYEKVHSLSLFDGLTQVYVRRHLEERIEEELQRSYTHDLKLSVLMLDLDYFKNVNDKYGHLVGDRILKTIASVIQSQIREVDLVGRYGGEEFVAVLPDTDQEGAIEVAERIRSAVAKNRFRVYDDEIRVTVSIGIATFPDHLQIVKGQEYDPKWKRRLVDLADSALYLAKDDGRNQVKIVQNPEK